MSRQYDLTMKKIFGEDQEALIRFFAKIPLERPQPLNIEFQTIEGRSLDFIFLGTFRGEQIIVHFEFQSSNDSTMDYRMLRYAAEIYAKYKLPVFQEVIYIGASALNMPSSIFFNVLESSKLDFTFGILDLGEIPMQALIETGATPLYPLLPLTERERRKEDPESFLRNCVLQILNSPLSVPQKRDLVFKQELFSGLAFKTEVINIAYEEAEHMLDLTQSAGYKRIVRKGEVKGFLKGEVEGFRKGEKEGFKKGHKAGGVVYLQKALMDVLVKVSDPPDSKVLTKITQLYDPEVLHQLLLAASTDKKEFYRILASK